MTDIASTLYRKIFGRRIGPAGIEAEIRTAFNEQRAPIVNPKELVDWVVILDRLLLAGQLEAVEHSIRHLHASYPRLTFARNAGVFDRIPPADGVLPFCDDFNKDVQIVERHHADTALLLFCGHAGRLGLPLPLIHRWLGKLPAHLIYLRDFQTCLYAKGISSLGSDFAASVVELRKIVRELKARRILCYGNSAGVFGALQYGVALEAEAVVCLSGLVNISPEFNTHSTMSEKRRLLSKELPSRGVDPDARRAYQAAQRPPRTLMLFGSSNWDDRIQAEHMASLPTVTLRAVESAEHNIIIELILRGEFDSVLDFLMRPEARVRLE